MLTLFLSMGVLIFSSLIYTFEHDDPEQVNKQTRSLQTKARVTLPKQIFGLKMPPPPFRAFPKIHPFW